MALLGGLWTGTRSSLAWLNGRWDQREPVLTVQRQVQELEYRTLLQQRQLLLAERFRIKSVQRPLTQIERERVEELERQISEINAELARFKR
jgi:hypothetical protein